jgi:hypothetical protein
VRGAPLRADLDRPGGLAPHDDALGAVRRQLPGLEAQAGVPAREAGGVRERRRAPLLVAHEQQRDLGEVAAPLGERAQHAEREHDAALHVDGARAEQVVAVAVQRLVMRVRDHRVGVAQQQEPAPAAPAQAGEQVGRVPGGGAGRPLHRRIRGQQRGADRRALLRAVDVARGRRDRDERLQLALRAARDLRRLPLHPGIHARMTLEW